MWKLLTGLFRGGARAGGRAVASGADDLARAGTSLVRYDPGFAAYQASNLARAGARAGNIARSPIANVLTLGGRIPKWGLPAAAVVGGSFLFNRGEEPGKYGYFDPNAQESPRASAMDLYNQRVADQNAALASAFADTGYGARARAGLDEYLRNMDAYVDAQAPAIRQEFADLGRRSQAAGLGTAAEYAGAGMTAEDIYRELASQAADYGAGEGLSVDAGALSGLTGPSGAMLEAPIGAMTQGASLSDYLTREGTIARDLGEELGRSYEAQGIGAAAQMAAAAQALGARERYNLEDRLAQYEADRAAQRAQTELALRLQQQQDRQMAEQQDLAMADQQALLAIGAPTLWESIKDSELRKQFRNYAEFKRWIENNPRTAGMLLGMANQPAQG